MAESFYGTGRRKTAIARVTLKPGAGKITINKNDISNYLGNKILEGIVSFPFKLTSNEGKFDVDVKATGGGIHAQAEAIRLGVSRALVQFDQNTMIPLKKTHCLTRDSREVERKKYGQRGARAKFQYSKR